MRNFKVGASLVLGLCFAIAYATPANADTCPQGDNLLTCLHVSAESCRVSVNCANDIQQALTAQDVLERAATVCCSLPSSDRCLTNFANRLHRINRGAPVIIKSFLGKARRSVLALKDNGCSTGSLGNL